MSFFFASSRTKDSESGFQGGSKMEIAFSELHLKVDKSCELYDFCVDLLQSGGIRFSAEVTACSIHFITPSKLQKQD